jgi:hypothetical protein
MTTVTSTDLAGFLLARIAYDEHGARMLQDANPELHMVELRLGHRIADRVLAECDAKRGVVETYRGLREAAKQCARAGNKDEANIARHMYAGVRLTMELLAMPYRNHPDYREDWGA